MSRDYALTRIGREPAREMIMARLAKEPLFASNINNNNIMTNNDAALNMFTCRYGHDINSSLLEPHGLLIAMEPCSRSSSTSRRNTVAQKHIYDTMWTSQTTKSQLSRNISVSLEYHTYNLET